tara:strand:- start:1650 stop:2312 length:663 start_codon:yes stop_codon:yes gene_type:complete
MPKIFKNDAERLEAQVGRLHTQKLANHCNMYNKKIKEEIEKPHSYKKFRDNFMKLVASKKYSDKLYHKHISYCELEEIYEAFEYGTETCICGHRIKIVAQVRYRNPDNSKEYIFNVGSSCIINATDDTLRAQLDEQLHLNRIKAYTCYYCRDLPEGRICLLKDGRAEKNFNVKLHKCESCSKKHFCRHCRNETPEEWMSICKSCWIEKKKGDASFVKGTS